MATDAGPSMADLLGEARDAAPEAQDESYKSHSQKPSITDRDDADTCRICRGEGSVDEPLFYPCKCSGSIKYVHQECLMEWLSHTQKKHCELCKTSFRFTKLYHPTMPNRIPTAVFIRRATLHVLKMLLTWCRAALVVAVWLLLLPWCMRVVWRSLFWVGDGGWAQDVFLNPGNATDTQRLDSLDAGDFRRSIVAAETANMTQNMTLNAPFFSISYSTNASATDSLLWTYAKRLFFGFPYPLTSVTVHDANRTLSNLTTDAFGTRNPSLLSEVPFFHLSDSQASNRFIIDVLEGQIITLLVVVAFILIFLIREWVVQQQPVINMVALGNPAAEDRDDNLVHEAQQEDEREELGVEEAAEIHNDLMDAEEDNNIVPVPRRAPPHHRMREEVREQLNDILDEARRRRVLVAQEPFVAAAPIPDSLDLEDLPTLDQATFPHPAEPSSANLSRSGTAPSDLQDPESPGATQRPIMPSRDQSFIATGIRRSLEEGNEWSFENVPQAAQADPSAVEHVPDSWEDEDAEVATNGADHETSSNQEQNSENSSESWQQITDVLTEDDSDQVLEGEKLQDKGKERATNKFEISASANSSGNNVDMQEDESKGDITTAEDISLAHVEHEVESHQGAVDIEEAEQEMDLDVATPEEVQQQPGEPAAPPQPEPNTFNLVLDWMFGDVAPITQAAEEPGNDEHIVQNMADEAPFVPFAGNEPQAPANAQDQDQDPEVAAAAARAGIDVNDQEAIEDAEDLEGILELIGMQGPIVGLFQNVLFSAVLISATLTLAVWLPYLWGKIVILVMGSPFSLLVKLPLKIVATATDLIVDLALVVIAGTTYWFSQLVSTVANLCASESMLESVNDHVGTISTTMKSLAEKAMDRIGELLLESPLSPRPDYFRLSVNSHAALRSLQNSTSFALNETSSFANTVIEKASADSPFILLWKIIAGLPFVVQSGITQLLRSGNALLSWLWASKSYKITFDLDLGHNTTEAYTTMERWTASDRMIAIFAGYTSFAIAGAVYLKRGIPFSTSQNGQKVEGIIADVLQQAGGVLKVILIISIEMLAFPLYCGLLLDLAMLPLFKNATLYTRWQFACESPWTSGFVHWFLGTCYMFHFALFVSLCRKIMRKGVLYFIRDPDDPTFHPVRDVLERSVTTQLRKIGFSALVYGALVIVCLGGVVWTLSRATSNVLPIHWTTEAPSLEFPLDLLFYNFLTPVIIKFYKPSESLHSIYQWWFKKCASFLRLSNFLFGEKAEEQEGEDGKYVRAPASDQARIPKGQIVFVEVDKDNVRKDGNTEGDGVHNSDLVAMVFIPGWFRLRIFAFVITIWIFMGLSGVSVTIIPLLFGRYLFSLVLPETVEMNDIHAFSLGIYTLGSIVYSAYQLWRFISSLNRSVPSPMSTFQTVTSTASRVSLHALRFTYVWASLIFAIPFLFAILIELYFLMPLHAYLGPSEPHVVHIIQDWTLGFLYSRLAARLIFANNQSRPARAFNAVIQNGYLNPNARIATRCFLAPVLLLWTLAIALPSSLALATTRTMYAGAPDATRNMVWRFSFPAVGLSLAAMWASRQALKIVTRWRLVVRDEVYLIGERLHNFGEKKAPTQSRATEDKIRLMAAPQHGEVEVSGE